MKWSNCEQGLELGEVLEWIQRHEAHYRTFRQLDQDQYRFYSRIDPLS
jgi:hypothetical protein